jgi:hypothetical protein
MGPYDSFKRWRHASSKAFSSETRARTACRNTLIWRTLIQRLPASTSAAVKPAVRVNSSSFSAPMRSRTNIAGHHTMRMLISGASSKPLKGVA